MVINAHTNHIWYGTGKGNTGLWFSPLPHQSLVCLVLCLFIPILHGMITIIWFFLVLHSKISRISHGVDLVPLVI